MLIKMVALVFLPGINSDFYTDSSIFFSVDEYEKWVELLECQTVIVNIHAVVDDDCVGSVFIPANKSVFWLQKILSVMAS